MERILKIEDPEEREVALHAMNMSQKNLERLRNLKYDLYWGTKVL